MPVVYRPVAGREDVWEEAFVPAGVPVGETALRMGWSVTMPEGAWIFDPQGRVVRRGAGRDPGVTEPEPVLLEPEAPRAPAPPPTPPPSRKPRASTRKR